MDRPPQLSGSSYYPPDKMIFPTYNNGPSVLREAAKARRKPAVWAQILIFAGLYFLILIVIQGIPMILVNVMRGLPLDSFREREWSANFWLLLPTLAYMAYVKFIEKRSLYSMGFVRRHALRQYAIGALSGVAMMSVVVGICMLTGTMEYEGVAMTASSSVILLWLGGFLVQGMHEEVICRGYLMVSLANRTAVVWAILINSLLFSAIHLFNPEVGVLPLANLVLYGVFASIYFLRTNNIWGVAANHSLWNFTQGNLFGMPVSGMGFDETVFSFRPVDGYEIVNGGAFGVEGGIVTTIVYAIGILLVILLTRRKQKLPL